MKFKVLLFIGIISVIFLSGCTPYSKSHINLPCPECTAESSATGDEVCKPICEEVFNDAGVPLNGYTKWIATDVSCRCTGNLEDLDKINNSANKILAEEKEIYYECPECTSDEICFWAVVIQCMKEQKGSLAIAASYNYDGKSVCAGDCYEGNDDQKTIGKAISEKNPELCNDLPKQSGDNSKDACFYDFAWWTGDSTFCERILEPSGKEDCYTHTPQMHRDFKKFLEN